MFYWLTELSDGGDFFNLFRYITFRAGGAFMTALIFGFLRAHGWDGHVRVPRRRRSRSSSRSTTALDPSLFRF